MQNNKDEVLRNISDNEALSNAIIERLGPHALSGGKMSVLDAFEEGWRARAADDARRAVSGAVDELKWSPELQKLFGSWLDANHPNADSLSVIALGAAWLDGRKSAALQPAQTAPLDQNEQYRMQMAGISTAAIGYWKESDGILPEYDTPALHDVAKLYEKYAALYEAAQQPSETAICGDSDVGFEQCKIAEGTLELILAHTTCKIAAELARDNLAVIRSLLRPAAQEAAREQPAKGERHEPT